MDVNHKLLILLMCEPGTLYYLNNAVFSKNIGENIVIYLIPIKYIISHKT